MEIEIIATKFYQYSVSIKGFSKQTIKRYKYVINSYRKFAGVSKVNEVTVDNVRNLFFYGRTERHWSPNTFLVFYKSLSVFFKWCISQGYLQENPIADLAKPKLEQKLPKRLAKQDALRLLEIVYNYPYSSTFLRYRNHALFAMFIYAGLRLNECMQLKYSDVDLENKTIFIHLGKGSKDRMVPISSTLSVILQKYLIERKKLNKTCPEFFASYRLNQGFTQDGLKHLVEKIRAASKLKFSVHRLRHTFATLMIEGGCDIYSLSKMMGHGDIKTTTIYLSASIEHLQGQIMKHPLNTV